MDEKKEKLKVIAENLLPYLSWNDLLRLRRVCKTIKTVVHKFAHEKKLAPASLVEINDTDKAISNFLQIDLPISRIYVNNQSSGPLFFEDKDFPGFKEKFGNEITHLRLYQMSRFPVRREWHFFRTSLRSLCHLEIDRILDDTERVPRKLILKQCRKLGGTRVKTVDESLVMLPTEDLDNLKYVKVGIEQPHNLLSYVFMFTGAFIISLKNLEHLCLPFAFFDFQLKEGATPQGLIKSVAGSLSERARLAGKLPLKKIKIVEFDGKVLDAYNYSDENKFEELKLNYARGVALSEFLDLMEVCVEKKIKIVGVNAALFQGYQAAIEKCVGQRRFWKRSGETVLSLVNLHSSMVTLEMPNLEKLAINKTSQSSVFEDWEIRPVWGKLKILEIHADRDILLFTWAKVQTDPKRRTFCVSSLKVIWDFLFREVTRPALQELKIRFSEEGDCKKVLEEYPLPDTMNIVSSSPNLTKIWLTNWLGDNDALVKLWRGLEELEEICLDSCINVGTDAFTGEEPVFLKLKKLRKLSLKGLDKMPKITDQTFSRIFRHLKVKVFLLQGDQPLKSVTVEGIRSLLTGDFATFIETFPFKDFQLDESTSSLEEVKKVAAQFRSSHMI